MGTIILKFFRLWSIINIYLSLLSAGVSTHFSDWNGVVESFIRGILNILLYVIYDMLLKGEKNK